MKYGPRNKIRTFCCELNVLDKRGRTKGQHELQTIETEFDVDRSMALDVMVWMHLGSFIREVFYEDGYPVNVSQIEDSAKNVRSKFGESAPSVLSDILRIVATSSFNGCNYAAADVFFLLCLR
jgi:hypothetical protein